MRLRKVLHAPCRPVPGARGVSTRRHVPPRTRSRRGTPTAPTRVMLDCSVLLYALSIVAALFGFTGIAASAAALGEILLYTLVAALAFGLVGALFGGSLP